MFTVSDIIHLIQYYYHIATYEMAAADVDTFRLESIRGESRLVIAVSSVLHAFLPISFLDVGQ